MQPARHECKNATVTTLDTVWGATFALACGAETHAHARSHTQTQQAFTPCCDHNVNLRQDSLRCNIPYTLTVEVFHILHRGTREKQQSCGITKSGLENTIKIDGAKILAASKCSSVINYSSRALPL